MKKDCKQCMKEKGKEKKNKNKEEKNNYNVKREEVNTVSEAKEADILFTSNMGSAHLVAIDESVTHDWVLNNGASFHVTPNRDWFIKYDAGCRDPV